MLVTNGIFSWTTSKVFSSGVFTYSNTLNRLHKLAHHHSTTAILSKAFSNIALATHNTFNRSRASSSSPTYRPVTTALFSTTGFIPRAIIWTNMSDKALLDVDVSAAARAFKKSNPFDDPEAHNCTLSFHPTEVYANFHKKKNDEVMAWLFYVRMSLLVFMTNGSTVSRTRTAL